MAQITGIIGAINWTSFLIGAVIAWLLLRFVF